MLYYVSAQHLEVHPGLGTKRGHLQRNRQTADSWAVLHKYHFTSRSLMERQAPTAPGYIFWWWRGWIYPPGWGAMLLCLADQSLGWESWQYFCEIKEPNQVSHLKRWLACSKQREQPGFLLENSSSPAQSTFTNEWQKPQDLPGVLAWKSCKARVTGQPEKLQENLNKAY